MAESAAFVDRVADALEHVVGMTDPVDHGQQAHLAVMGDQGRGLRLVEVEPSVDRVRCVVGAMFDVTTADLADPGRPLGARAV
jgi:hypothetical protein